MRGVCSFLSFRLKVRAADRSGEIWHRTRYTRNLRQTTADGSFTTYGRRSCQEKLDTLGSQPDFSTPLRSARNDERNGLLSPVNEKAPGLGNANPHPRVKWCVIRTLRVLIVVSLLAIFAGCGKGPGKTVAKTEFEVDKVYERGPATVHVRLDKTKMTIADTVLLQFEATLQPGYEMQMPKVDQVLENFGIVDWDNLGGRLDDKNNIVTTHQYRLEPFLSGQYEIPAFTFTFHDVNDPNSTHELASEPVAMEVTSLLGEQRAKLVIEDIEGVVEMPRPARWWWLWFLALPGVGVATAGGILVWALRAKQLVRIFRPAHEVAYARLRVLVNEQLIEQGRIKEFYERISGILRYYIEDRFRLRAPERTTEEFLAELQHADVLSAPDKDALREFLTHCDLVKFARHDATTEQIQRTFDLVRDFIERTKSDAHQVDVTDQATTAQTVKAEVA